MAIIYDLSTGKVISESEVNTSARAPRYAPKCAAQLHALDDDRYPEAANPCDAYMVLLQRLLRDL